MTGNIDFTLKFQVVCGHFITFTTAPTVLPCVYSWVTLKKKLMSSECLHPIWDLVYLVHKKLVFKKQNPLVSRNCPNSRTRICFLEIPVILFAWYKNIKKKSPLWVPTAVTLWWLSLIRHLVMILVAFQHHRISGLRICSTLCMTTFKPPII